MQPNYPNKTALNRALDIYLDSMRAFVMQCMRRTHGEQVRDSIAAFLNDRRRKEYGKSLQRGETIAGSIEFSDFPHIVNRGWREVFVDEFNGERGVVNRLWLTVEARNRASHRGIGDIEADYVQTRLYDVAAVLDAIRADTAAFEVRNIRDKLHTQSSPQESDKLERTEGPSEFGGGTSARPDHGLNAWRTVARPNSEVTDGSFRASEFAADLQQVHDGRADATLYGQPINFFKRTHVTPGLRALMENVLQRIAGTRGDPVIQTKTGFGGGKTHSLIAIYHLARNTGTAVANEEIQRLVADAGLDPDSVSVAKVAVLDGTYLSPTSPGTTAGGDPLNTLWGEMAYQLGGQAAYEIVGMAARVGSSPGGAELDKLLEFVAPCVILVDELVLYGRNAGVDWDTVYTFVQNLTQSVRRTDRAVLVIALPDRAAEAGGERGAEVLAALDGIFGRIEATWKPLEINEAFEVVRRRLFDNEINSPERQRTCEAFSRLYGRSRSDWPSEVGEQQYLNRMQQCYPIHPEIFDRLYEDWSTIPRFQRTRGVLRLMASCISRLYRDDDPSPLIMPGDMPFRDTAVSGAFSNLLDGNWDPVFSEADGDNSRADGIDASNRRYGDVGGASRRIARTILLGSAPGGATRGIDIRSIRLGVVRPGHGIATYNEAIAKMAGELHYLYVDGGRYWFHAEENLNKVAADRQGEFTSRELHECIVHEIRSAVGRRQDVVVCPTNSGEVHDDGTCKLVILPPQDPLPSRSTEPDLARTAALDILRNRASAVRMHKNSLVFLAAKNDELRALSGNARAYLAWDSVVNGGRKIRNLTGRRASQAHANVLRSRSEMETALVRAWRWALSPSQPDPLTAEYDLSEFPTEVAATGEIIGSAFAKLTREEAVVRTMSADSLSDVLSKYVWPRGRNRRDHIRLAELHNIFTANVYMPRLNNIDVLIDCARQGVENGYFGFAQTIDNSTYANLRLNEPIDDMARIDLIDGLVVERGMAELVLSESAGRPVPPSATSRDPCTSDVDDDPADIWVGPGRIIASTTLDDEISLDVVRQLSEEIVRGLRDDGGQIEIEITIRAQKSDGFTRRAFTVTQENGAHLGISIESQPLQ